MDNRSRVTEHEPNARRLAGNRPGFTILELMIVMIIAGVIATIALPRMGNVQARQSAANARDALVWMGARARARAIERASTHLLQIDPAAERAWIVRRNPTTAADTAQVVNFQTEFDATVSTTTNAVITICYNTRGYAWSCDAGSPTADELVTFETGRQSAIARVRPLGQIERQ